MRVVVSGATGFLGRGLVRTLALRGAEVVALTRAPTGGAARQLEALGGVRAVGWDASASDASLAREVDGADVVVNLAGEPLVGRRWSAEQKQRLHDSRVVATRALVEAIRAAGRRPALLVSGSAIGYYGARGDETLDESAPPGTDFLARLCVDWEAEARRAEELTRVCVVRTGIVLGEAGGALEQMLRPFRLGVGGPLGDGRQWMSWIALHDWMSLVLFAIDRAEVRGPLNATAPEPVRNRDFAAALGRVLHRPSWLPAPRLALRIALGEVSDTLVQGQRVVPARVLGMGFRFTEPLLEPALRALLTPR